MFDLWVSAFLARHVFALLAVQPLDERCDMFLLACLVTVPPMAGRVDDYAIAAGSAGDPQVDLVPRAVGQILKRLIIFLARQPAEGRFFWPAS